MLPTICPIDNTTNKKITLNKSAISQSEALSTINSLGFQPNLVNKSTALIVPFLVCFNSQSALFVQAMGILAH